MKASEAYARLRALGVPAIKTAEAAALFQQSAFAASKTLGRLAKSGLILRLRSGTWWLDLPAKPYRTAPYLTAPFPSYISLYSALHVHDIIEQIPVVVYVISLGRTRRERTRVGAFSIHHIRPELFGGFSDHDGAPIASPEKALFDLAYVAGGRSKLEPGVPELSLPKRFRPREIERWIQKIPSERSRTLTRMRIQKMLRSVRA